MNYFHLNDPSIKFQDSFARLPTWEPLAQDQSIILNLKSIILACNSNFQLFINYYAKRGRANVENDVGESGWFDLVYRTNVFTVRKLRKKDHKVRLIRFLATIPSKIWKKSPKSGLKTKSNFWKCSSRTMEPIFIF